MAIRHPRAGKKSPGQPSLSQRTPRGLVALGVALLVLAIALGLPIDIGAASGDAVTAHDCTVTPLPPGVDDGLFFTRAQVLCTTEMAGRFILIELSERRDDDAWEVVDGASMTLEVPEPLLDETLPPDQAAPEDVDGHPIACPRDDATRAFRTEVTISDGQGNDVGGVSESAEPYHDCMRPIATDAYMPKPADCRVAPISDELLAESWDVIRAMRATPYAPPPLDEAADPLDADEIDEAEIPEGIPADAETIAAITALEQQYAACLNAGEFRRAAALVSEELRPLSVAFSESFHGVAIPATPIPPPLTAQIPSVQVRGVRVLPDGRVAAIVDWLGEENVHLYEQIEGRWVFADEISVR